MPDLGVAEEDRHVRPGITGLAPVRLIVLCGGVMLVVVAATILTKLLVPPAPSPLHQLVMIKNLLLPIAVLAIYAILVRWLEHRPASEIALDRGGVRCLAFGLMIGTGVIAATVLVLWSLGLATIGSGNATGTDGLISETLVPFATAVIEEVIFRAILFRLMEQMFGTTLAALASSALFGAAHFGNPGATAMTSLFLALDIGLLLAVAFAASRSLWLPIGLHMGWNFSLGYVFGTLNSGMSDPYSLLRTTFAGSAWFTGGTFGLEGSIVTLTLSMLLSVGLAMLAWRNGSWQARRLRR